MKRRDFIKVTGAGGTSLVLDTRIKYVFNQGCGFNYKYKS